MVPGILELPEGCKFCTRCDYKRDRCEREEPELEEIEKDHFTRCHFARELRDKNE